MDVGIEGPVRLDLDEPLLAERLSELAVDEANTRDLVAEAMAFVAK